MTAWDVDELVDELDRRTAADGETWEVWRTSMRQWCVRLWNHRGENDPLRRSIVRTSLVTALRDAISCRRIPTIPRRPQPVFASPGCVVKRSGSYRWWAEIGGVSLGAHKTKTEAQAAVDRYVAVVAERIAEWDTKHGSFVAAGVEGADFVYEGNSR